MMITATQIYIETAEALRTVVSGFQEDGMSMENAIKETKRIITKTSGNVTEAIAEQADNPLEKMRQSHRNFCALEEINDKLRCCDVESAIFDEITMKIIEEVIPHYLSERKKRIEEWIDEHLENPFGMAAGSDAGEPTEEEQINKLLYKNIVCVRGLMRAITTIRTKNNATPDKYANSLTIAAPPDSHGCGGSVTISPYKKDGQDIACLNILHHKVLIASLMEVLERHITKKNKKDRGVYIGLKKFQALFGAKNVTTLRKNIEKVLLTLQHETWQFESYLPGEGSAKSFYRNVVTVARFLEDKDTVYIEFGEEVWKDICSQKSIMAVPTEILQINAGRHPYAFFLYSKLAESKNNNHGKPEEGKISFATAIRVCSKLPTKEEVARLDRNYRARITKPILDDAKSLVKETIGSIKFMLKTTNPKTREVRYKPISYKKALELPYDTAVKELYIFADKWTNYPDAQVEAAQARYNEKLEKAAERKKVREAEKLIKAEEIRKKSGEATQC